MRKKQKYRYSPETKYGKKAVTWFLAIVIFLIAAFKFKNVIIWGILSFIAVGLKYCRIKNVPQLPIVFEPVLFVATVLTRGYGFEWSLLFLLGPNLISEIVSGGIQFTLLLSSFKFIAYQLINILLGDVSIIIVGILLPTIDLFVDIVLNVKIFGQPPIFLMYNVSTIVCHAIYFSIFGEVVVSILRATI